MTKICNRCNKEQNTNQFTKVNDTRSRSICHSCRRKKYKDNDVFRKKIIENSRIHYQKNKEYISRRNKKYYHNNLNKILFFSARKRAKTRGLDFNLELSDIIIPIKCPVFGFDLVIGNKNKQKSPSLDRIDNNKGYIKGNIIVVSFKANTIKNNATVNEIKKVYDFYKNMES